MTYIPIGSPLVAVFSNTNQAAPSVEYSLSFNKSLFSTALLETSTQIKTILDCAVIGDARFDIAPDTSGGAYRFSSSGIKSGVQRGTFMSGTGGGGGGMCSDLAIARFERMKNISLIAKGYTSAVSYDAMSFYSRMVGVLT